MKWVTLWTTRFSASFFLLAFTMASRRVTRFPTAEEIEQVTTDHSIVEPELSDGSDPVYWATLLVDNPHRLYLRSVCL